MLALGYLANIIKEGCRILTFCIAENRGKYGKGCNRN